MASSVVEKFHSMEYGPALEGRTQFLGKWQAANSFRREKQEQATATTTADSFASLRNDSQKGKSKRKRRFPSGMTNK
jgi:hypothetical protein